MIAMLLLPIEAICQVTTTVTDTIYSPSGTPLSGMITITNNVTFQASDGTVVPQGVIAVVPVTVGAFTVNLIPNQGSTPTGTSYQATYFVNGTKLNETWTIPQSSTPVNLSAVRVLPILTGGATSFSGLNGMISAPQIASSPVTNDCLIYNGSIPFWSNQSCGLFASFQVNGFTPMTGIGKYFQLNAGNNVTISFTGNGTQVSPYVATINSTAGGGGDGTVTNLTVGNLSPLFNSSVSSPTTTPVISFSLMNAPGNSWFGVSSDSSTQPAFNTGTIPASLIPALDYQVPIASYSSPSNQFITGFTAPNAFTSSQPSFSGISGILAGSQLPAPTNSSFGGVESAGPVTHEWINSIPTSGVPSLSQPAFVDISGQISTSQVPTLNQNTTGNAATATSFASYPALCSGVQFSQGLSSGSNNCANVPPSLLSSFQINGNTPITSNGNYLELNAGTNITIGYSGAGTFSSPYVATINASGSSGSSAPNQSVSFTNSTSASLMAISPTTNIVWSCWDSSSPANSIQPSNVTINPSTYAVTFSFTIPQSGYCVINQSGPASYTATESAGTTWSVPESVHDLGPVVQVATYDSSGNLIDGNVVVDSSGDVTVTWLLAQSGKVVLTQ